MTGLFAFRPYFRVEIRGFNMQAVNELISEVYGDIGMVGAGEVAGTQQNGGYEDTLPAIACQQLNRLITKLNNEGYLSMCQKWVDTSSSRVIYFKKLKEGETVPEGQIVIDMEAPEKIDGVSRMIGNHFIPLTSIDAQQMFMKNPLSLPTCWNYGREVEDLPQEYQTLGEEKREYGILRLDGTTAQPLRIFYNSKMPKYTLTDTIYLSDLYNELLFSGLKYYLACYFELSDSKKADCYTEFTAAKTKIKRNNITQRMMKCGTIAGSYTDNYYNGYAPTSW